MFFSIRLLGLLSSSSNWNDAAEIPGGGRGRPPSSSPPARRSRRPRPLDGPTAIASHRAPPFFLCLHTGPSNDCTLQGWGILMRFRH